MRVLAILLFVSLAPLGQGAFAQGDDWMSPGTVLEYAGVGASQGGAAEDPSRWTHLKATMVAVDAENVTVQYAATGVLTGAQSLVTYARGTRQSLTDASWAVLWIGPDDVARGEAMIGTRLASHVATTPLHHQFVAGSVNYYYDAQTGILSHVQDLDTGSAAVRVPT